MEQLFGRFDTPTDKYGVCKIVTVGGAYRSCRSRREIRSCLLLQSLGTIARGVDTLASVKLLGSGGVVYRQAAWRLICVVAVFLLVQISGRRRTMPSGFPSLWWSKRRCAATSCSFFGARYGNHGMGKSDPCPCDGFGMYCYQFNNAAYPSWFLPYVTFLVPMPALSIVVFGLGTNLGWRGGFFKYVNCGDSKTLVVFRHSPVDYSYAIPEFLDFFPGNSAHDFVYFGGPLIDSNTQWLVGGGGGYGCDVMGFVWGT